MISLTSSHKPTLISSYIPNTLIMSWDNIYIFILDLLWITCHKTKPPSFPSHTNQMASSISQTALFSILLLLSLHQAITSAHGEKQTHLRYYLHEFISGPNATSLQVVNAPNSTQFVFGAIEVVDDLLREGSDASSKLIGQLIVPRISTKFASNLPA